MSDVLTEAYLLAFDMMAKVALLENASDSLARNLQRTIASHRAVSARLGEVERERNVALADAEGLRFRGQTRTLEMRCDYADHGTYREAMIAATQRAEAAEAQLAAVTEERDEWKRAQGQMADAARILRDERDDARGEYLRMRDEHAAAVKMDLVKEAVAQREQAEAQAARLGKALERAAQKFREYEGLHVVKGTAEGARKAAANRDEAEACEAALQGDAEAGDGGAVAGD